MDHPKQRPDVRFVGDFDDPWVVAIAETFPSGSIPIHAPGDLPDTAFGPADIVVIHRQVLTRHDAERLRRYRSTSTPPPHVVLCHGSHVRYEDLSRWSELVDATVHEATAVETLSRHVRTLLGEVRPPSPRRSRATMPAVVVVSTNFALRQTLREAVESFGFRAVAFAAFSSATPPGPAIWDVPWLEPNWPHEIARRSENGPLIALIGFADRRLVTEARAQGAAACLELPLDLADLAYTLDRLTGEIGVKPQSAHDVPPAPALVRYQTRPAVKNRVDPRSP